MNIWVKFVCCGHFFPPIFFFSSGTARWLWSAWLASLRIISSDFSKKNFSDATYQRSICIPLTCTMLYSMWYCWPKYFLSVWFRSHIHKHDDQKREVLHCIYYCNSAIHKIFSKYILYRKQPFLFLSTLGNDNVALIFSQEGKNYSVCINISRNAFSRFEWWPSKSPYQRSFHRYLDFCNALRFSAIPEESKQSPL